MDQMTFGPPRIMAINVAVRRSDDGWVVTCDWAREGQGFEPTERQQYDRCAWLEVESIVCALLEQKKL